jgi:excisionase family DNA binding protein
MFNYGDERQFNDVLTFTELMDYLAVGKNTAYRLLRTNQIKSARIGHIYKIPKVAVQEFLRTKMNK